jgi:transposase
MAPPLSDAQHLLIDALLKEGFENKLIASEAKCKVRTVQRIRQKRQQPEMPTPRTKRGRRSCITSPMKKTFFDTLTEQPYLYRCEMADLLYRRYHRKISERSIGRILRSTGWTRTTIRRIAQQRDADLRDHYLHRMSKYKSYQLVFVDESGCDGRAGYRRWGGLQRVLLQSRSQSSVGENDGTSFQHTRKMASYYGGYAKDQQTVIVLRISLPSCCITVARTQSRNL